MKGIDMTLSNFYFRIKVDKSNPYEIIPIYFIYKTCCKENATFTHRCGTQKAGITSGKVHGHDKPLLPHIKPGRSLNIFSHTWWYNYKSASVSHKYTHQKRIGRSSIMKESTKYTPITETKSIFSIPSEFKGKHYFSKATNFKFTKSDTTKPQVRSRLCRAN